jgi:CHASE2 domain-containing sensor protein
MVFVSYKRGKSSDFASLVAHSLEQHLGARRVFFDEKNIAQGKSISDAIKNAEARTQVFVPIIGEEWIEHILQEDSWIKKELDEIGPSVKKKGAVVWPVAESSDDLKNAPEVSAAFRNVLDNLDNKGTIIYKSDSRNGRAELARKIGLELQHRRAPRLKLFLLLLSLLVMLGLYYSDRLEPYRLVYFFPVGATAPSHPREDAVRRVIYDNDTEKALVARKLLSDLCCPPCDTGVSQPCDRCKRRFITAKLINELVRDSMLPPRVIALDITFDREVPTCADGELGTAVKKALGRDVHVVYVGEAMHQGELAVIQEITDLRVPDKLHPAIPFAHKIGGSVGEVYLAIARPDKGPRIPSLALAAVAAFRNWDMTSSDFDVDAKQGIVSLPSAYKRDPHFVEFRPFKVSELYRDDSNEKFRTILSKGTKVASMWLEGSVDRGRNIPYKLENVLEPGYLEKISQDIGDKIILFGFRLDGLDEHKVGRLWATKQMWGVDWHYEAVMLLQAHREARPGQSEQLLIRRGTTGEKTTTLLLGVLLGIGLFSFSNVFEFKVRRCRLIGGRIVIFTFFAVISWVYFVYGRMVLGAFEPALSSIVTERLVKWSIFFKGIKS